MLIVYGASRPSPSIRALQFATAETKELTLPIKVRRRLWEGWAQLQVYTPASP